MSDVIERIRDRFALLPDLGTIYQTSLEDPTAFAFCLAIAGVFFFGLVVLFFVRITGMRRGARFVSIVPGLLTTLGVLGTFTGILLGLSAFDVDDIDGSIPPLLAGLSLAFVTSITGMVAALLFRVVESFFPGRRASGAATASDLRDLLERMRRADAAHAATLEAALSADGPLAVALNATRREAAERGEATGAALAGIRDALSSDSDSSLGTQLVKLRATVQDGQAELIREFRDFSRHMTENTNKAIVEALENVIRDFNDKITEQFGDNFKELNRAVGALLEWQENYRKTLEETQARIEAAATALHSSETALGAVREHSAAIPAAVALLAPPLAEINEQSRTLATHLEAVGGLREKALDAFPVIETNIATLTEGFSGHVETALKGANDAATRQQAANEDLSARFGKLSDDSAKAQETFAAELERALGTMTREASAAYENHSALIDRSLKDVQQQITDAWKKTEESIDRRMGQLDDEMEKELERALATLGGKLASLSDKFVSDYTPLTESLRDLVRMAERAR